MLISSDVYVLINYVSFVESSFIAASVAGLLWLRVSAPKLERPIRVNLFFPIFFMLIMAFLIIFPLVYSPYECGMGVVLTLTGVPFYWVCVLWKNKPKAFHRFMASLTATVQKLVYAVPEDCHED